MTEEWKKRDLERPNKTSREVLVRKRNGDPFSGGIYGSVSHVDIAPHGNQNTPIRAVEKRYHATPVYIEDDPTHEVSKLDAAHAFGFLEAQDEARHSLEMFNEVRKAGLPTFGFMRFDVDAGKPCLIMSDLSEGGMYIALSPNNIHFLVDRRTPHIVEYTRELLDTLTDISFRAARHLLVLSGDSFFFRIDAHEHKRTGTLRIADVVIGDLDTVKKLKEPGGNPPFHDAVTKLADENERVALRALETFQRKYTKSRR